MKPAKLRQFSVGDTINSDEESEEHLEPPKLDFSKASATTRPTDRTKYNSTNKLKNQDVSPRSYSAIALC